MFFISGLLIGKQRNKGKCRVLGGHQFSSKIYVMLFHQVITLTFFLALVTRALEKIRGKTHVRLFSSPDRSSVYLEGPSLILFI